MTTVPFLTSAMRTGVPFGIIMGVFFVLKDGVFPGVILGIGSGALFGLIMAAFGQYQSKKLKAERPAFDGEDVVEEGPANHFLNGEGVGGWLFLTDRQLFFKSHAINIQKHELSIPLAEIVDLTRAKSLGIIPNQLHVRLRNGNVERFVLNKVDLWKQRIEEQVTS